MPLQATSGAASYDAFGGGVPYVPTYIEELFSTWLYTGNNAAQTINNGLDLSGKGGLVWTKNRTSSSSNELYDTSRGATNRLVTNATSAQSVDSNGVTSFSTTGYVAGTSISVAGQNYVSWTFREQPKFFDIVTWTGNSTANRAIAHSLGSTPGCIIVKKLDSASGDFGWPVWHRSLAADGANRHLFLNTTDAWDAGGAFNAQLPTSTEFYVGNNILTNLSGSTYVAYLFAHNAGGFGLTGADNVISCGSYTGNGSTTTGNDINLGFEAQFVLVKNTTNSGDWRIYDNMRGMFNRNGGRHLYPNLSSSEGTSGTAFASGDMVATATGFRVYTATSFDTGILNGSGQNYIYVAIRRGPMKVPTTGTSVFGMDTLGGTLPNPPGYNSSFPVDMAFFGDKGGGSLTLQFLDRLRQARLISSSTVAEDTSTEFRFDYQNGFLNSAAVASNWPGWMFRRAPGFMDVCCYTGTGANRTVAHNLAAVPELMIVKRRSATGGWAVYSQFNGATNFQYLNTTAASSPYSTTWNDTAPTASVFTVGTDSEVNASGGTFVTYLFASCPGVSKVGSFTGTGATQVIDCGFTGGARFVLIKATSTTGNWLVWDSARGIVSGNDPYLALNSTAAEVTNTDWVDTAATGFELSNAGGNLANSNGVSYIFLAIS